ncbi:MCE family protein [Mycolicibacterium sp. XJ1819]
MTRVRRRKEIHPRWWAFVLPLVITALVLMTTMIYTGAYKSTVKVVLKSDRSGLGLGGGEKVKMRGVQVGSVGDIRGGRSPVSVTLDIDLDQAKFIPENVGAEIRATTAFGAKYVDLTFPVEPSEQRLSDGQVIVSRNVSTEVNTVFQNLVNVLDRVDAIKLNSVLSAIAEALRGQGERIGDATTAATEVLEAINPRAELIREDWQSLKRFSDTYGAAAHDLVAILDAASTTSTTVSTNAQQIDLVLLSLIGFGDRGSELLGASKTNLVTAVNALQPTTSLLMKYDPALTCTLVGGKWFLDNGGYDFTGGHDGRTLIVDVGLLLGDDPYRYPEHLPIIGAKGGPGGKPSCGSLPIVDRNLPVRALVTNTGFGTGLDLRPNPGIGHPFYANYFPGTRAVPEPPSIRGQRPGPAIGPVPYPGAPPYGARLYAPDGTPLYPGLPPGIPSDSPPPDPAQPPPGAEPFTPAHPARIHPTPLPVGPPP